MSDLSWNFRLATLWGRLETLDETRVGLTIEAHIWCKYLITGLWGSPHGVVANKLGCDIEVSKFEL